MDLLSPAHVDRIHAETDAMGVNRNFLALPMASGREDRVAILPDGRLFIRCPPLDRFEAFVGGLRERLTRLDLARCRRPNL